MNWFQLERYLERDDRIVLPLGSTEQHAYLSLGTDTINAERVALEAAEPLGVPVLPALAYGVTPSFAAFPGSPSLGSETYSKVVVELLDSLFDQGFRRFFVVNGHYGNRAAAASVQAWATSRHGAQVLWHDWLAPPATAKLTREPEGSHASWIENFPWTRLPGVVVPAEPKPIVHLDDAVGADPASVRELVGDGSFGGPYELPDEDSLRLFEQGVADAREALAGGWP
jgi:creatinine amidohydrolase